MPIWLTTRFVREGARQASRPSRAQAMVTQCSFATLRWKPFLPFAALWAESLRPIDGLPAGARSDTSAMLVVTIFGLEDNRTHQVVTPAVVAELDDQENVEQLKIDLVRAAVGTLLWLRNDRPDIKFVTGHASEDIAPSRGSMWARERDMQVTCKLKGAPAGQSYSSRRRRLMVLQLAPS